MAQRVDLWCSGEKEVDLAVQHLYKLGKLLNEREPVFPKFVKEFYPGVEDIQFGIWKWNEWNRKNNIPTTITFIIFATTATIATACCAYHQR